MPLIQSNTQKKRVRSPSSSPRALQLICWQLLAGLGVCLAVLTISPMPQSQAQDSAESTATTVVDIRIEGNETIPESVILQKIQTQPNREISERLIREDKRSLMGTRWFFSVSERFEETPQGRVLIFTVHERPIVQKVTFNGNKGIKTKMLAAWTGLKEGSPFDHIANRDAVNRIEQEYKEKGYYFVKVVLEKGGNPGDRQVVFRIDEGPKVRVQHRTFEGNKFWNPGDLKKNLASKEALLGFFGGFYRPETLPQDVEALKQFYRSVGFFDAEVVVDPRFSPDRSAVDLHFKIKEGVRYKVRDIRFQGNQVIATKQLQQDTKLTTGQFFNSLPLSKDVRKMLKQYGELGHYFASVVPVPHFTETPGIVDLVLEIDEDRPRYIRNIDVAYDGDYPHTKQTVVWDRMQVFPGDLANPDLIRRSKSRLGGSGLFEPNIQFDVTPVEPESSSFAALAKSRTFRAQNSDGEEASAWTDQFAEYTRQAAYLSTVGSNPWSNSETEQDSQSPIPSAAHRDVYHPASQPGLDQPARPKNAPAQKAGQQYSVPEDMRQSSAGMNWSRPVARMQNNAPQSPTKETVTRRFADVQSAPGGHSGFTSFASAATGNPTAIFTQPAQVYAAQVYAAQTREAQMHAPVPASQASSLPTSVNQIVARPNLESKATGFRSLPPTDFFQQAQGEYLSTQLPDPDAPVIRAQSPGPQFQPQFFDPSAPGPRDGILEGSPYRNQFQAVPPGWVDINVRAAEGRTGRLMFGAGVNSDAGLVGSFVWDESNFDLFRPPETFADIIEGRAWRGGGQRFRLEAAPGNQVSRYTLSWTDPYFMYSDYSLTVSGFYFNRFYPDWNEDRLGGRVGLGRQLTPEWSVNAALRLEEVTIKNARTPTPDVLQRDVGNNFLSTVRVSATHDTRDMAIMPGEGHFADFGYEQAFNEYTFPKVEGEFRQYYTLRSRPDGSGRHVLTLAGNLGWSGDDTPVFERYFAGGFQSFRGYSFRGVTPRTNGVSTGGTFQMLGTLEYRLPVTADDMINFVAFTDFGTVEEEVTLSNFRATAGFGMRVVVPAMGPVPLAFDFAFPIKSQSFDDERIFSFYVGVNR